MKSPTLKISIKDPQAEKNVEILSQNKSDLNYQFGSKSIQVKPLNENGNKVIVELMKIASDYRLS